MKFQAFGVTAPEEFLREREHRTPDGKVRDPSMNHYA